MSVGEEAPDFTLLDSDSNEFNFSDLDGEWKVIFFYAKDGSPTCKRGCLSFKEQYDLFRSLTPPVEIIGISEDSASDHIDSTRFAQELEKSGDSITRAASSLPLPTGFSSIFRY